MTGSHPARARIYVHYTRARERTHSRAAFIIIFLRVREHPLNPFKLLTNCLRTERAVRDFERAVHDTYVPRVYPSPPPPPQRRTRTRNIRVYNNVNNFPLTTYMNLYTYIRAVSCSDNEKVVFFYEIGLFFFFRYFEPLAGNRRDAR